MTDGETRAAGFDDDARLRRALEETWAVPRGVIGWLSVVDHRSVGRRYLVWTQLYAVLNSEYRVPNTVLTWKDSLLGKPLFIQVFLAD